MKLSHFGLWLVLLSSTPVGARFGVIRPPAAGNDLVHPVVLGGNTVNTPSQNPLDQALRGASVRLLRVETVAGRAAAPSFACSGTLTATNRVVTSAHCFDTQTLKGADAAKYLVEVTDPQTGRKTLIPLQTMTAACSPETPRFDNSCDLAVGILSKPAAVKPIPVCQQGTDFTSGRTVLAGSGISNEDKEGDNSPLKYVDLNYDVMTGGRMLSTITRDEQRPCAGDSGGGVIHWNGGRACLRAIHRSSVNDPDRSLSSFERCRRPESSYSFAVNLAGRANMIDGLARGETPTAADVGSTPAANERARTNIKPLGSR